MTGKSILLIVIPIILSAFTHLWNPVGFPDIFSDEGVYMRRAMHVLEGLGPQETATYYDNPFFGQLFLATIYKIIGFPNSLNPSSDVHSIEMLYLVPRILMGILAVIDTFLIYKISERQYNRNVALISSILFAVMPMTWFVRGILLESIQLPFLLSSILVAIYTKNKGDSKDGTCIINNNKAKKINNSTKMPLVLLSGMLLGLAIFTKIPVFVTIPLVGYLIFTIDNKSYRSWKILALWFVPVILIPLIWPAYSVAVGQFDHWWNTVIYQTERQGMPFLKTIPQLVKIDPVLMVLATAGLILAALKKDVFILLWAIPILVFFLLIEWGWSPYQLFIPLIPLFCITTAAMIVYLVEKVKNNKIYRMLPWTIISAIVIFGLVSTTILITTNVTAAQFQTVSFVSEYLDSKSNKNENITVVSNPAYSWIFKYVYGKDHVLNEVNNFEYEHVKTNKILFISDIESKGK